MTTLMDRMFVVFQHTVKPGSYVWKYHKPPPRRHTPRRSNAVDMDSIFDVFEHLEDIDDYNPEDLDIEDLDPFEMAFLLMQLRFPSNSSSDEEADL